MKKFLFLFVISLVVGCETFPENEPRYPTYKKLKVRYDNNTIDTLIIDCVDFYLYSDTSHKRDQTFNMIVIKHNGSERKVAIKVKSVSEIVL